MKHLLLGLLALMAGPLTAADRPNILFVLADNWLYDHAGANGDPVVQTPAFDRIAREGMRFTHAFCPVPSCSPTRSSILTGRAAHQLAEAANLWSLWPARLRVFTDALRDSGYRIGYSDKGWAPGNHADHGRAENPAGPKFASFGDFLNQPDGQAPFFFWLGDTHSSLNKWPRDDHRPAGIDPAKVRVPSYLPDTPEVRNEIADYLTAVETVDATIGIALSALETRGLLENTIIVHTSDNGWQMPHGLAHCYDAGTHVPLAVRWPAKIKPGSLSNAFVSLTDLAPTFLEMAGVKPWHEITGRSFVDVLQGKIDPTRDHVFIERERHANVRRGNLSYPVRGIRTERFLYLRNLRPDRWPAGDPELHFAVGPFGDVDGSVTKQVILSRRDEPAMHRFYELNFARRPAEELYDLATDPEQINNLAADPNLAVTKAKLSADVDTWMHETSDPRVDPAYDAWDTYPYYGGKAKK